MYKLDLEKAEEPEIKLPTSVGSLKKQESSRKASAAAAKSLQSCLTLCGPMDSSTPGSSVHRILQARRLEWAATPIFKGHLVMPALLAPRGCGKVVEQDTPQPRPAQSPLDRELCLLF